MEQSLFVFFFIISFIFFMLSIFKNDDYQIQGMFALISGILFLALTILSFNIEIIYFNVNTNEYITYNMANYTLEAFVPMGISFIISIISFLHAFQLFTYKSMTEASKGLEMPKGFENFNNIHQK